MSPPIDAKVWVVELTGECGWAEGCGERSTRLVVTVTADDGEGDFFECCDRHLGEAKGLGLIVMRDDMPAA